MKLNILKLSTLVTTRVLPNRTYEGAPAPVLSPEQALRRSVLACLLWEHEFYEDGVTIADRIRALVPQVAPERVAALAVEARSAMKLRHMPLLLVREMARYATHRSLVAETLAAIIQRADELTEFVAIYWAEGRIPLSGQVKKGLAAAFPRFDEYALAKYDRPGAVRLRDVLFLVHPKPRDAAQAALWKRLANKELATPDTWEVALSAAGKQVELDPEAGREVRAAAKSAAKREVWERLLTERKLGALALLRNLRNLQNAQVDEQLAFAALADLRTGRVLPFRFLAAARHAPQWEEPIEAAMLRALRDRPRLVGHTVLLVDVSGSMEAPLSRRSELQRTDAAYGLAILLRELAEKVTLYTFSHRAVRIPPRRGFALRDALHGSQPHAGTYLGRALEAVNESVKEPYDRIIVITDEQSHDHVGNPQGRGYVVNIASARNGVGYGAWTHIDGWSEAVLDYIREAEHTSA